MTPIISSSNALWLGGSGSVAALPALGKLLAGIETIKKPANRLRLWAAVGVALMGACERDHARHRAKGVAATLAP